MPIYFPGGKPLFVGGKFITTADECCCNTTPTCTDCPGVTCVHCSVTTPNAVSVLFGAIAGTPRCQFITTAEPNPAKRFVYNLFVNLAGVSVDFPQSADPCVFETTLSPGLIGVDRCLGDGSGCAACSGGTDITTSVTARIRISGTSYPVLEITITTPVTDGVGVIDLEYGVASTDLPADICCGTSTVFLSASSGFEDRLVTLVDGSYTVSPCAA